MFKLLKKYMSCLIVYSTKQRELQNLLGELELFLRVIKLESNRLNDWTLGLKG